MPELKIPGAYFVALGGMAALGVGLFALFKKKHWV
jgi:LPXTG-motif cell wall-anchored protein